MPDNTQSQSQSQALNLTLHLGQNTSDPQLEQQVFNELYSAGRQIGRVTAVLDVLLAAVAGNPALQSAEAATAIAAFQQMQADIARVKEERALIKQLQDLRVSDPAGYDKTITALRAHFAELRS